MAKTKLDMIHAFGQEVEAAAGAETRQRVMAGSEALSGKTGTVEIALWVRDAIDRLDAETPPEVRNRIMETCGRNCILVNQAVITRGQARRAKFADEAAFLAAEIRKPQAGTRLERQGNLLVQTYTPRSFSHPMRCYCGLLRDLPAGKHVSATYCHCSQAFVQAYWSGVLGRDVKVDILETAVTGSDVCRFRIKL
jgi:hypothetical protein